MNIKRLCFLTVFFTVMTLYGGEEEKILLMKIGDPSLKNKVMDANLDRIVSAKEGKSMTFSEMIREMDTCHFIYVGETHNNLRMHDIQLKVIQALHSKDSDLSIGLEMFPTTSQEVLNKWSMAILSEEDFIRESRWYVNWNFNFGFYAKIFRFAKENKIPLYALNADRSSIHTIRMKGWQALTPEEKAKIPEPDLTHREHRELIRTVFESTPIPHQMKGKGLEMAFDGLYRAQSAWDEVMAHNASRVVQREEKKMVILAGSGHLLYNLGINRRAYERTRRPFKTLICIEIPEGEESVRVSRSVADFIWGIPEETQPAFPSIGLRLKKINDLENLIVESDPIQGVAKMADFKKGDVILSVDGKQFTDINELRIYLAQFLWNDEVEFRLLRQGQEIERTLKLHPPE